MSCQLTRDHSIILNPAKPLFEDLCLQLHRFCHPPLPDQRDTWLKAGVEVQPIQMLCYQAERKTYEELWNLLEKNYSCTKIYARLYVLCRTHEIVKDVAGKIKLQSESLIFTYGLPRKVRTSTWLQSLQKGRRE